MTTRKSTQINLLILSARAYSHKRLTAALLRSCIVFICLTANATATAATLERPSATMRKQILETIADIDSFEDRFDAEVWLIDMNQRLKHILPDSHKRLNILKLVHRYASAAQLSPQLVLSVIEIESRFDHYAVSSAGAQGLMQVMPFWKKELGRTDDNLADIDTNLRYGCAILTHYLKKENGDLVKALARYNGSTGETWYPERVMMAWERRWFVREY